MQKLTILLASLFFLNIAFAQKKAVTETGEEVILYDDKTWEYVDKKEAEKKEITLNPKTFKKNSESTFLVKSTKVDMGIYLNTKKWSFKKADSDEDAEYSFQLKNKDLYGMLISEKVEIPLTSLKEIALENGRAVSPDLKIVKEEYRNVNGIKVLMLQMNGTIKGIKFTYFGYYYSKEGCTVQFLTYTSRSLFDTYKKDCEILLNGLTDL